jgi:glycosyltransferase involved in cell wall biosynthesis
MLTPLILVSNQIKTDKHNFAKPSAPDAPKLDYLEIARELSGELRGYNLSNTAWSWIRQIEQHMKLDLVEALCATRQLSHHNIVLSTSEKIAIPLAVLLELTRQNIPHIVIGHKLSTGLKTSVLRRPRVCQNFTHMICVSQAQRDYAIQHLNISDTCVDFVYDKVDHRYFTPVVSDTDDYILTVGKEQRDYRTLLQAVASTGIKLIVVASSPWSTHAIADIEETGDIVVMSGISYQKLKDLYANARLVVVPLFDVDYAAGVNTVLEAMAMAKPVIVSKTRGIVDYVKDGETGIFVPPEDANALKDAILSLRDRPQQQTRLGTNARQVVEEKMNLDRYVERVTEIVRSAIATGESSIPDADMTAGVKEVRASES